MTTDLKALAAWHAAMAAEPKRNKAKREKHAATATVLRTLADADAKMPVVALRSQLGSTFPATGEFKRRTDDMPLVYRTDALAAILAATERAEKAEKDAARLREAAAAVIARWDSPLWKDVGPTGDYINMLRFAVIDQHLGAAK